MKMNIYTIILVFLLPCVLVSNVKSQDMANLEKTENQEVKISIDSLSYGIGVVVAKNLQKEGFQGLDSDVVAQAILDVLNNADLKISADESDEIFRNELKNIKLKEKEMNKAAGEEFLTNNATKEGVMTTESGLQYEVMVEGDGPSPKASDSVKTHYHGTLIDGTVFDSSVERGQPISFPLGNVIQAWQEALPLMKVGSKYRIYSPYNLAYGERGAGGVIKPYSALIFEIELLGIE